MKPEHVKVISEFLDDPRLLDIHTYTGYKGGVVCRFRTSSEQFVTNIYDFCEEHNIECTSKFNHNLGSHEIFVIAPDDVYSIKDSKWKR